MLDRSRRSVKGIADGTALQLAHRRRGVHVHDHLADAGVSQAEQAAITWRLLRSRLIRLVPRVERPGFCGCAAAGCAVGDMMVIGCLRPPECGCSILDGFPDTAWEAALREPLRRFPSSACCGHAVGAQPVLPGIARNRVCALASAAAGTCGAIAPALRRWRLGSSRRMSRKPCGPPPHRVSGHGAVTEEVSAAPSRFGSPIASSSAQRPARGRCATTMPPPGQHVRRDRPEIAEPSADLPG